MSLLSAPGTIDASTHAKMAYSLLWTEYQQAIQKIQDLEKENAYLKEQLLLTQQRHFGKKTEIGESIVTRGQLQTVSGYVRQKGRKTVGRNIDTSGLPRYKIYHDLKEDNRYCQCGCLLQRIGEDISEQLEVVPLRLYVIEHIRGKYSCHQCHIIQMAPKPMAPIPKAMAGSSLLTEVSINISIIFPYIDNQKF